MADGNGNLIEASSPTPPHLPSDEGSPSRSTVVLLQWARVLGPFI
ncbi:hypothetical protein VB005_06383 [Metarhizium brunneum]